VGALEAVMLYLVPTPIGNLADITLRALDVLRKVDLIACEDTRHTGVLLAHYGIDKPTVSYHDHNERRRAPNLIERMQTGQSVALVTDAGSPALSDPGFYLVRLCRHLGIRVEALPGATALIPALTASGLPCERFVFEGFLPARKGRRSRLAALADEHRTFVLYEGPHRLVRTLQDLARTVGEGRTARVARELTKKFEESRGGSIGELAAHYAAEPRIRGEFVIVVGAPERKKSGR